jgi:hypothetical protein
LWFSGFSEPLFQVSVIVFSPLLLVNLILYLLPVVSIAFNQSPCIFFKLVIDISNVPVYLSLVIVVLLAVLSPKLGAVSSD